MAKVTGSVNNSMRVALAEEEVSRCGQEESFLFQAEREEELPEEVPMCVTTKEVIGTPTMNTPLLVPELKDCLLYTSRCV